MTKLEIVGVVAPPPRAVHVRAPFVRRRGESGLYRVLDPAADPNRALVPLGESGLEGPDFLTWPDPLPYEWGTVLLVASDVLVKELSENRYSSDALRQLLHQLRASSSSAQELPSPSVAPGHEQSFRVWKVDHARFEQDWIRLATAVEALVWQELRPERIAGFAFDEGHELLRAIEMTGLLLNGQSQDLSRQFAAWKELILEKTDGDDAQKAWLETKMTIAKTWHGVEFQGLNPRAMLLERRRVESNGVTTPVTAIPRGKWDLSHEPKLGMKIEKQNKIREKRERKARGKRLSLQGSFQGWLRSLAAKLGAWWRLPTVKPVEW